MERKLNKYVMRFNKENADVMVIGKRIQQMHTELDVKSREHFRY